MVLKVPDKQVKERNGREASARMPGEEPSRRYRRGAVGKKQKEGDLERNRSKCRWPRAALRSVGGGTRGIEMG